MKKLISAILAVTMTVSALGIAPATMLKDITVSASESNISAAKLDISKIKIEKIANKTYTGKAIKPKFEVYYDYSVDDRDGYTKKIDGKDYRILDKGIDYSVSYKNNKSVGKATIIIKGKGIYTGTVSKTFKIIPKKSAVTKAYSPKKGKLKLTLKKVAGVTGYQITYGTNRTVTKNKKVIYTKKTTKTITGLKKGKTYYFKVRAYKTIKGKKYFSKYSIIKPAKVIAYTNKTLNKAMAALIKGNSTKKQRELIRQYEINYVSKTYPDKILDEKLCAFKDKNGKPTEIYDESYSELGKEASGNCCFNGGWQNTFETGFYYWGEISIDKAVKKLKNGIKECVDSDVRISKVTDLKIHNYNVVIALFDIAAENLKIATGKDLPLYYGILCFDDWDGINNPDYKDLY